MSRWTASGPAASGPAVPTGRPPLAAALPTLQATPGSFWVDPITHRLYTHSIAAAIRTPMVARRYVPAWATTLDGRVINVAGGGAATIGGDGGFGYDPANAQQAQGQPGIGSNDWNDISIIDSCQWSRAGKHTFSATGGTDAATGFVVFRSDTASEGPGGVFVGYWSHFVDYTGFSGIGSAMSIYDGDVTVNGSANIDAPGGTDADPTYLALIAHSNDATPAFSHRLIENCDFGGTLSLGGPETVLAEMRNTVVAVAADTFAITTMIDRSTFTYRLPGFGGGTAIVTNSVFAPHTLFTGTPRNLQGTVTLDHCTLDFTHGVFYSTAWTRTAALSFSLTNSVILNENNVVYGLIDAAQHTDSITVDHSLIQGPTGFIFIHNFDGGGTGKTYADALTGTPGLSVTNTRFVANAKLNPTTYAPLPGSLAVGQAVTVANAPDYTGTIWAVRHTAGASRR